MNSKNLSMKHSLQDIESMITGFIIIMIGKRDKNERSYIIILFNYRITIKRGFGVLGQP